MTKVLHYNIKTALISQVYCHHLQKLNLLYVLYCFMFFCISIYMYFSWLLSWFYHNLLWKFSKGKLHPKQKCISKSLSAHFEEVWEALACWPSPPPLDSSLLVLFTTLLALWNTSLHIYFMENVLLSLPVKDVTLKALS